MTARKIQAGAAVAQALRRAGVRHVFGVLGGSMLELYDALYHCNDIRYIGARDERAATHMADACARLRAGDGGGPGVVLGAQAGPGAANLVTGLAEAHLAYSPVVAIAGMVSRRESGRDTFQEIDQQALFAPVCKRSFVVPTAARLPEFVAEAARLAMSGRRGPVVLNVPRDLFAADISCGAFDGDGDGDGAGDGGDGAGDDGGGDDGEFSPRPAEGGAPHAGQLQELLAKLARAKQPVIVAGGGVKWGGARALEALRRLAETLQIPVVASTGHNDVLPGDHPLAAGQAGPRGNRVAGRLTRDADLLLALGTRLGFNSTFHSYDYITRRDIVQVDVEAAAIGRYFPVSLGIVADAGRAAEALLAAARAQKINGDYADKWREWRESFFAARAELHAERAAEAANDSMPLSPLRVLGELREVIARHARDAITVLDTGAVCLQAADRLPPYRAPGLITPLDFGLVGFGYPAALGAAAACPGRPVLAVSGDGGFSMTLGEVATAVQHRLNVVAVVLDNAAWGAEKSYQKDFFGGRYIGADLVNPPFDQYAKLCGARGYAATAPGETAAAVTQALTKGGPAVVHVQVDPAGFFSLRKDLFTANKP